MARFRVFHPNPPPLLVFCDHTTPPLPPPRTCHRATPTHHPPLPFHTACPKPSHGGSVSGFSPKPPSPHVLQPHNPPPAAATAWYGPPCHPHAPSAAIIPHGVPATEPRQLGYRLWPSPHLPSCFAGAQPTTTSSTPLHHLPLPLSTFISVGAPEIKPQWLNFWFLALN